LGITDRYGIKDVNEIYVLGVKIQRILFKNEIFGEVGGI
jgi:hypothetical protein